MNNIASRAQITDATLEHRLFGAAYSLFLAFAAWVLLVLIVSGVQGGPLKEATWAATLSLCGISTLVVLGLFIHGLLKRGEVIEDCSPNPMWKYSAGSCALLVFVFLISFATQKSNTGILFTLPCMIVICLSTALSRLQICQNGILLYISLIRWDQIRAYEWAEDGCLLIKRTSRLPNPEWLFPFPPIDELSSNKHSAGIAKWRYRRVFILTFKCPRSEPDSAHEQALNAYCGQIKAANHPSTPLETDPC